MEIESKPSGSYLVNKSEVPQLIKSLEGIAIRVSHRENRKDVIYFNNEEHELYFGQDVRAKKYSKSVPRARFLIFQDRGWTFEQKGELHTSNSTSMRTHPGKLEFFEIAEWLQSQREFNSVHLMAPLVPFVVNSYEHMDFLINGDRNFKITVDSGTKHYAFLGISAAVQTGQEDFARVNLKMHYERNNYDYDIARMYRKLINSVAAVPVVSKMDAAYNLLGAHLMQEAGLQTGQTDTEIEGKLSLDGRYQYLFNRIKSEFAEGMVKGFTLMERFPHTIEGAKISTYLITEGNEYIRLSAKGDDRVVTTKEGKEIMGDPYGLGCILRRKEIESTSIPNLENREEISIYKNTKHFMVTSKEGNEYCISIDRCSRMGGRQSYDLYQMEIESTMMQPSKEQEADAARDIASIIKQLIDMHDELSPTTLTKQEWVSRLR